MGAHRAEGGRPVHRPLPDVGEGTVYRSTARPDPFRAPGVPDRLVLVLYREGMCYVGTLSTWEYHAIDIRIAAGPGRDARVVREMVVDTSTPHSSAVLVRMYERPTAARVVAELVTVLRGMISELAGRDRRTPPRPAADGQNVSRRDDDSEAAAPGDRTGIREVSRGDLP